MQATRFSHRLRKIADTAPMLDPVTERAHLELIQSGGDGSSAAMSALIGSHLRLVLSMARRYVTRGLALDDLVSEGVVGLCEAADRFDLGRESRFSTYAMWWVRARIRAFVLKNRRVVAFPSTRNGRRVMGRSGVVGRELAAKLDRPPTTEELAKALDVTERDIEMVRAAFAGYDVSLSAPLETPWEPIASSLETPESEVARAELSEQARSLVARALCTLDERELAIIEQRHLSAEPMSLRCLGERMGLSRERVRQLEVRAKEKLRRAVDPTRAEAAA
jgi:RNA polymerase sigma-32 factor